jgi:conjugative transfer signal peptidase TraF
MTARAFIFAMMASGAALVAAPVWSEHVPRFIWNASASLPIGLYSVEPATNIAITDVAIVRPPNELATFLAERGYLPKGVPLLKRVFAFGGETICREGRIIIAYGGRYAVARERDSRGRPLPIWQGCRTLDRGEVFLMNWDTPDSFDSRYFGPLSISAIVGRAVPVWTSDDTNPAIDERSDRPVNSGP